MKNLTIHVILTGNDPKKTIESISPLKCPILTHPKLSNNIIRPGYNFFIYDYEVLIAWEDIELSKNYYLNILQGDIITKETRLINPSIKFNKFNIIEDNSAEYIDCTIYREKDEVIDYKRHPSEDLYYYFEAFSHLKSGKTKQFLDVANFYLSKNKKIDVRAVMLRYYIALVYYILEDFSLAVSEILF